MAFRQVLVVALLGLLSSVTTFGDDDWGIETEFNDPKPSRLNLEADICQSYLRMRVNRSMQREYEDKSDDEQWIEMLETFKQEEKEVAKELENDQTRFRRHFGAKFDTRTCGNDATAHTAFERLSAPPPDDPKQLEEYMTLVPEPNIVVAVCGLRAAAEAQVKVRTLATSLDAQRPGAKKKSDPKPPKRPKGKKGTPPPAEPTAAATPAPSSAKIQQMEDGYVKRFGKKIDFTRCEG